MKTKLLTVALVSGALMTGCASTGTNGTAEGIKSNKAILGAIGGALGGAAISKATGGEKTGRDAAIGAVIGAGVGAYMQKQEAKLKEQTAGTGIEVTRDPRTNDINLVMPESITFDKAQSAIKPQFYGTLSQVASTLNQYNQTTITVKGHASSEGDAGFNQRLSESRATSVANYLMQQGVLSSRINTVGYGSAYPVASNATEAGRMQNRRVELTINAPQSVN